MRPRFNRVLEMHEDGKVVVAKGPIELREGELPHEAYITAWITQGEVSGIGADEKEEHFFPAALTAAEERLRALSAASRDEVDEAGPLWDVNVQARGQGFKPGPAKAEAWLMLELPGGHEYRVMWTDDVTLTVPSAQSQT